MLGHLWRQRRVQKQQETGGWGFIVWSYMCAVCCWFMCTSHEARLDLK